MPARKLSQTLGAETRARRGDARAAGPDRSDLDEDSATAGESSSPPTDDADAEPGAERVARGRQAARRASDASPPPAPRAAKKPAKAAAKASPARADAPAPAAKPPKRGAAPEPKRASAAPEPKRASRGAEPKRSGRSAEPPRTARSAEPARAAAEPRAKSAKALAKERAVAARGTSPKKGGARGRGEVGEGRPAPSFEATLHDGSTLSSDELAGSAYVLYFYPKDDTPGCTREACDFRDELPRFESLGVRVLGVSPDSPKRHQNFRGKYQLPFELLSDERHELATAYGVWVTKKNYGREYEGVERSTFLVDARGVVRRIWRKVSVAGHVADVAAEAAKLE